MNINKITIRLAQPADQQEWDAFVQQHADASPYHLFAWKEAVEKSYGHTCYYMMAEQKETLVGLLPMVHIHMLFGVNELVALPYCDVGNCLCKDVAVQDGLVRHALELGRSLRVSKLCLRGDLSQTDFLRANFVPMQTGKVRMLLDLPPTSDELLAGFKSKLRSQIHKAEKNDVVFRWGKLEDLQDIYQVFSNNMHSLGSPVHSRKWLQSILTSYKDAVRAGLATHDDTVIGMGIILAAGQTVAIPWASTLREYNRLNPNMFLYWNFLKFSADSGYKMFDFGRTSQESGTFKFKQQWGAKPKPLMWHMASQKGTAALDRSKPIHAGSNREKISEIWRKIPLPVANMLGPRIRKYISL